MAYIGKEPANSFINIERQVFTIVNSQTAYTLSHSVTNENDIRLVINNVIQEPGTGKAYTASGTTLTLSAALTNGTDEMYCVYLGRALQTVNAPDNSIGSSQVEASIITGQTALAVAPDSTDELLISDAGTLKRIDASLIGGQNTPAFYATGTTQTNVSSDSYVKAQFDSEEFDTAGDYDHSTNYRFTPTTAGKYYIFASIRFFDDTDTDVIRATELQIYKNGTYATPRIRAQSRLSNSDADYFNVHNSENIGAIVEANGSSDYFEVYWIVKHEGSNVDVIPNFFGAYKLIGV